jgi:pimeloyl-ACP methyl ester carboxylesterase
LRRIVATCGACALAAALAGCSVSNLGTMDRFRHGLVIVLPGIEGRSQYNVGIARGLERGGVPAGIEIYDWGLPLGAVFNVAASDRNHRQARKLADRIIEFRKDYPGRPVYLVGHSAGAGLVVLTLEALPANTKVKAAYLLAAALSPEYELTTALLRTEAGIWNFYSNADVGFLRVGTSLFGTVDRRHGVAAGAVGFELPDRLGPTGRELYAKKLHQVEYDRRMARSGHRGSHTGWAKSQFVADWIAPLLLETMGYAEPASWTYSESGPHMLASDGNDKVTDE